MAQVTNTQAQQALRDEVARLTAERDALLAKARKSIYFKVSEKGGVSVYGLMRFPITLYVEQWRKVFELVPELMKFIEANESKLATRGE